ncbi:hypothetical protein [Pseudorhodoferax sp. Leaf265]|uniref:hypothetical protein n=1 Tax=Pseudorhodoferax sp. Leaf265 TaxID=1736315 RepID=UPI000701CB7B|nr:hypothetical protein [Pseudorhodoferax sp. Leaf265]KQP02445.1 hypothetical protein ASF45_20540 [Pseudorhodoferax sp. Leaf265]
MQIELLVEKLHRARLAEENIRLKGLLLGRDLKDVQHEIEQLEAHLRSAGPMAEQNGRTPGMA